MASRMTRRLLHLALLLAWLVIGYFIVRKVLG